MSILLILSLIYVAFGKVEITNTEYPYIPDEYIITYHLNTTEDEAKNHWGLMSQAGVEFLFQYNTGFHKGFAAKITDQAVLTQLQNDRLVMALEVNGIATTQQKTCTGYTDVAESWGLARTSHLGEITDGVQDHYRFDTNLYSGRGVTVYIIDTGIMITHTDFGGRASWGANFVNDGVDNDGNGHGTHCAGTAAGTQYGVAKAATLVAVKVLGSGGSGSWAGVVAGVDWVTSHGVAFKSVGSMSLGGLGQQVALTTAINNAVAKGIPIVVAAGNSNANACNYSPAGVATAISVAASEIGGFEGAQYDNRASFSNWGTCTHVFAPGRNIKSAWIGSNTNTNIISGTSMACPHVAGIAATILSSGANISPQAVKDQIQATAQKDLVTNVNGSPNLLLYNECHVTDE